MLLCIARDFIYINIVTETDKPNGALVTCFFNVTNVRRELNNSVVGTQ